MASRKKLKAAFENQGLSIAEDGLPSCAELCMKYGLSEDELVTKIDAWMFATDASSQDVTNDMILLCEKQADFTTSVQMTADTTDVVEVQPAASSSPAKAEEGREENESPKKVDPNSDIFAVTKRASPNGSAEKYHSRDNSGKTESTFNEHLQPNHPTDDAIRRRRCSIEVVKPPGSDFNPKLSMYTKPERRREAVDDLISDMTDAIKEAHGIENATAIGMPSQAPQTYIGRVVCEADAKMNAASVLLEGSVENNGGHRATLNLRDMASFALFPGQVVGVEGVDCTGGRIMAQKIIQGAPAPAEKTPAATLLKYSHDKSSLRGQPLSIMVACGPFTLNGDMDFRPLHDLMNEVDNEMPDILILMGPFVDSQHPLVKSGDLDQCFDQIFVEKVSTCLTDKFQTLPQTIIVPSTRDAFHHYVLPQPAFDAGELNLQMLAEAVTVVPNPVTLKFNEVRVAICSSDVLLHLSSEEVARNPAGTPVDRMGRLAEHMIQQRSFYPLHPPPLKSGIDLAKASDLTFNHTPDILIVPSDLKHFVKAVSDCVVVNPGRLVKGSAGGTFVKMAVHPVSKDELEPLGEQPVAHNVVKRARADIIRI